MALLRDIRKSAIEKLDLAGFELSRLDVDLLLEEALGLSALDIILEPTLEITPENAAVFQDFLSRRLAHEPVAQILGRKDFWTHRFIVTGDCLTPRPDSETLIEAALKSVSNKRDALKILDLGTGSGCLLLSLLSELPQSRGVGVDLSARALAIAKKNAKRLMLEQRCDFILSNWADQLPPTLKFDIILCNPPYIAQEDAETLAADVRDYEPHMALFAEEQGLKEYRTLVEIIPNLVSPHGRVFLEIGCTQAQHVINIFSERGIKNSRIIPDLAGRDRCIAIDFP